MIRRRLLPLLLTVGLLGGCTSTPDPPSEMSNSAPSGSETPSRFSRYVALGDSYTSAPYVYLTDLAGGCLRSDHNYPSLIAEALAPDEFRDVSCSGATTEALTGPQRTVDGNQPAQLAAVGPRTTLVTVGIGGNDFNLFGTLAANCGARGPDGRGGFAADVTRCGLVTQADLARTDQLRGRVARTLNRVTAKAPDARVVLIGYPRLIDPDTPCDKIPVAPANLAAADEFTTRLDNALRGAAQDADVDYLSLLKPSRGHEICSADPWVNGVQTDTDSALALHPFQSEQRYVADRIVELIEKS